MQLAGMIISEGTMRIQDLVPKFADTLALVNEEKADELRAPDGIDDDDPWWLDEEKGCAVLGELFEELNDIASDGHYFGAHPGDGALYGFWEFEED